MAIHSKLTQEYFFSDLRIGVTLCNQFQHFLSREVNNGNFVFEYF